MYVYTCTCGHGWACMRMQAKGQLQLSLLRWYPLSFFRQCLSLAWYLSNRLHRLAKSQESACYTPLSGWDFKPMPLWALGMEPGPHACRAGTLPTKLTLPLLPTHSHPLHPGLDLNSAVCLLCFSILLRYWDAVSTSLNWPWICCVAKNNLELLFSPKNYLLCIVFCGQVSHHSVWELNSGPVEVLLTSKSCLRRLLILLLLPDRIQECWDYRLTPSQIVMECWGANQGLCGC